MTVWESEREIDLRQLTDADLDLPEGERSLYRVWSDGVRFEFLFHVRPDRRRAVIFGNGALAPATRERWPQFDRFSWSEDLPVTTIYFFDPTCYEGEATLCWGYGLGERWYLREIAEILKIFLRRLGIPEEGVLCAGSSGGGFTAMMLACMLRARATVFNPQIYVENYQEFAVERLKRSVLRSPGEELVRERIDAPYFFRKEGCLPQIHIYQNIFQTADDGPHDLTAQLIPFLSDPNVSRSLEEGRTLDVTLFSGMLGHTGLLDKGETIRALLADLDRDPVRGDLFYRIVKRFEVRQDGPDIELILDVDRKAPEELRYSFALLRDGQVLRETEPSPEPRALLRALSFDELLEGRYAVEYRLSYHDQIRSRRRAISITPHLIQERHYAIRDGGLDLEIVPAPVVPDDVDWAFYLYIDGVLAGKRAYDRSPCVRFQIPEPDGERPPVYQVRYVCRHGDRKKSGTLDPYAPDPGA